MSTDYKLTPASLANFRERGEKSLGSFDSGDIMLLVASHETALARVAELENALAFERRSREIACERADQAEARCDDRRPRAKPDPVPPPPPFREPPPSWAARAWAWVRQFGRI
jgi:hypothetical protein